MEIDDEIVKELFKIAKLPLPQKITHEDLLNCVFKLKNPSSDKKEEKTEEDIEFTPSDYADFGDMISNDYDGSGNVLVVDDIGIVTYQLKVMLTNLGYHVQTAKDIFSGINIFIKSNFKYLIMDLFVSTEQEGYTLLQETKKIITQNNLKTKIIVITASSKAENKIKSLNGGADYFVKKDTGWQDKIAEIVQG